jgi:chromosome segregation ATPase
MMGAFPFPEIKMRFLFFLLASLFLFQGCGYALRMTNVEEQRRETENKRDLDDRVARLDSQVAAMQEAAHTAKEEVSRLQSDVKQMKEENRQAVASLQKKRADLDVRLDEAALQIRMIQGNSEKEGHRFKELSHQVENIAFRVNELSEVKSRLGEQEKKWDAVQKTLQGQIDSIKVGGVALQKSSEQQAKKLSEISDQVLELAEKIPPALNAQAVQLTDLGKQFEKMTKGADAEQVNKSLVDLSDALNILGQKITSKVDEQERLLQKTAKRLQALEAKMGGGKRSSLSDDIATARPLFSEIYYELGAGYYELNDAGLGRAAFERARQLSEPSEAALHETKEIESVEDKKVGLELGRVRTSNRK